MLCSRPADAQDGSWSFDDSFQSETKEVNGVEKSYSGGDAPLHILNQENLEDYHTVGPTTSYPAFGYVRVPVTGGNATGSIMLKGKDRIIAYWTPPSGSSGVPGGSPPPPGGSPPPPGATATPTPVPTPPETITVLVNATTRASFNDGPVDQLNPSAVLDNGFGDPTLVVSSDSTSKSWASQGLHLKTLSTRNRTWIEPTQGYGYTVPGRWKIELPDINLSSSVTANGTVSSANGAGNILAQLGGLSAAGDSRIPLFAAQVNGHFWTTKDTPDDKEYDAYASLDWLNDGVAGNPLTRIFNGSGKFFLTATKDGNPINLQNYQWSTSPEPYTPSAPPADSGTSAIKNYSWNLGSVADTDPATFPKSTTTTVTATDPSDGAKLTGKAKINWHLTPAMLYEFKIKHEPIVSDGDDPADATEMQVIQEYKQAYRDAFGTIGTGMQTYLDLNQIVVTVMLPDEFDLALGAGKALKVGKALAKAAPKIAPIFRQILTGLNNRRVAKGKRPYLGLKTTTEVTNKGKVGTRHPSVVYGEADEAAETTGKATEFVGSYCFVAGTPIKMADGSWKVIEQIQVGDQVLSRNEATKVTGAKRVSQTFVKQAPSTLVLTFSNKDRIETTADHPFYVEGKGFVNAGELGIGTAIVTRAGPSLLVFDVQRKDVPATVYNFEVEDFHTYFVGKSALWVHNNNDCTNFYLPAEPAGKEILATLSPDGVVDFAIEAGKGSSIEGHVMFNEMMKHFGDAVKAIGGNWTSGTNLGKINELTSDGSMISAEKVLLTWTGRQATAHGFTNVSIVSYVGTPGNYTKVNVIFTRP